MARKNETDRRPGFMVYFKDFGTYRKKLTTEELGMLFTAIYDYAETGRMPELEDRMLDVVFDSFVHAEVVTSVSNSFSITGAAALAALREEPLPIK